MMPRWHIIASAILAAIIFEITNSSAAALACLLTGIVLDVDHVFDYYLYSGRLSFDPSEISGFYLRFGKIIVLLHSYELLIIISVIGIIYHAQILLAGIVIGFLGHIFMDTITYEMRPQSYFLLYRVFNGFRLERLCGTEKLP